MKQYCNLNHLSNQFIHFNSFRIAIYTTVYHVLNVNRGCKPDHLTLQILLYKIRPVDSEVLLHLKNIKSPDIQFFCFAWSTD
jgi:hypothetical protein